MRSRKYRRSWSEHDACLICVEGVRTDEKRETIASHVTCRKNDFDTDSYRDHRPFDHHPGCHEINANVYNVYVNK